MRNGRCSLQQLRAPVPSVSQFNSRYVLQAAATLLPKAANNQRLTDVTETWSERGPMPRAVTEFWVSWLFWPSRSIPAAHAPLDATSK
eukprot:6459201-Amphidinium_carterae.2